VLIEADADVNFTDRSGATPLHWAAWNGHAEICQMLIEHGADPRGEIDSRLLIDFASIHLTIPPVLDMTLAKDQDGESPLDGAADNATKKAIKDLTPGRSDSEGAPESPQRPWSETSGRVNQTVKTLVNETVRLHEMVEKLVSQNGRLMENQQLLVAEVKRLRGLLGQPVDDDVEGILEIPVPAEQEEY